MTSGVVCPHLWTNYPRGRFSVIYSEESPTIKNRKHMNTIYRSEKGKKEILDLYDAQLARLGRPYKDIYVDTSYGRTHLIETGNPQGEPLLVFHGGNATTAYIFLACDFLLE